jgi:hypothetical protein
MLNTVSLKLLKTCTLKMFCKNVFIKNYSKLTKKELLQKYNEVLACKIIQRYFRKYFYKNAEDSISLEPVKFPCFIYRTKFGKCFFYNYESIIKYIMKTGDTRDPMTRNAYSDEDLTRLDNEVKHYFPEIRYSSTLKIKKNINYAKRIRNRENEILNFQMYLEELKNKLIVVIESDALSWENIGTITIDSVEYYSIIDYITVLLDKMKSVYYSLKSYDIFSASCFKENLMMSIEQFNGIQFIVDYFTLNLN